MSLGRRYFSRQLVLDGLGKDAQRALSRSRALVLGLGGTGSIVSLNLALAGVGSLELLDRDEVSLENLHRQPLYSMDDVGKSKAEVAAGFLRDRVPDIRVDYSAESIGSGGAFALPRGVDLVVDCLDNMPARRVVNLSCVKQGIPLVHTGSIGWDGTVAVFAPPETGCLDCLFLRTDDESLPSCDEIGTLGAVTSVVGAMGALEAIKMLAGVETSLKGRLLFYDGRRAETHTVPIAKRRGCPACAGRVIPGGTRDMVELCGGNEFYIARAFPPRSFANLPKILGREARKMGHSVVSVSQGSVKLSFFKSGGLLIKGVSSAEEARRVFNALHL